eukprot:TRINITY_DN2638_c0_g2_i8.p1 TRINITY_DN2638_c0_g2~~TRINITY_DN2638_c0_g2_i8.p1  ORF type:complete len:353 (-),score=64.25 TRINITY_DN2638_c0_g2_i8:181-1239(-)
MLPPTHRQTRPPTHRQTHQAWHRQTPAPTDTPSMAPTDTPTDTPSKAPTEVPTDAPTDTPSMAPTDTPTDTPSKAPTEVPTDAPTDTPSKAPTDTPTDAPTDTPSTSPTEVSTDTPSSTPTVSPTDTPTQIPTETSTQPGSGYTVTGEMRFTGVVLAEAQSDSFQKALLQTIATITNIPQQSIELTVDDIRRSVAISYRAQARSQATANSAASALTVASQGTGLVSTLNARLSNTGYTGSTAQSVTASQPVVAAVATSSTNNTENMIWLWIGVGCGTCASLAVAGWVFVMKTSSTQEDDLGSAPSTPTNKSRKHASDTLEKDMKKDGGPDEGDLRFIEAAQLHPTKLHLYPC